MFYLPATMIATIAGILELTQIDGDIHLSPPITGEEREQLLAEVDRLRQELQHRNDERQVHQDRYYRTAVSSVAAVSTGSGALPMGHTRAALVETPEQREEFQRQLREREETEQKALRRAMELLEVKIGPETLAKIVNGGAYPIQSKLWRNVVYLVPKYPNEKISVMDGGTLVLKSCLVTMDPSMPWPDIMLQRITALEIDETIVFSTGIMQQVASKSWMDRIWLKLRRGTR